MHPGRCILLLLRSMFPPQRLPRSKGWPRKSPSQRTAAVHQAEGYSNSRWSCMQSFSKGTHMETHIGSLSKHNRAFCQNLQREDTGFKLDCRTFERRSHSVFLLQVKCWNHKLKTSALMLLHITDVLFSQQAGWSLSGVWRCSWAHAVISTTESSVFNALAPEGPKIIAIQYWFWALPFLYRHCSGFSQSFNDILNCGWWI